jgi:hypothetical protein
VKAIVNVVSNPARFYSPGVNESTDTDRSCRRDGPDYLVSGAVTLRPVCTSRARGGFAIPGRSRLLFSTSNTRPSNRMNQREETSISFSVILYLV